MKTLVVAGVLLLSMVGTSRAQNLPDVKCAGAYADASTAVDSLANLVDNDSQLALRKQADALAGVIDPILRDSVDTTGSGIHKRLCTADRLKALADINTKFTARAQAITSSVDKDKADAAERALNATWGFVKP